MNDINKDKIPFVGLTAYNKEDSNHFYGREHAVEDILSILQKNKFVCLTGSSGSGKSSLIQAGLIPRLLNGFNGIAGDQWSICSFRPSDSPLENFAQALSFDHVLSIDNKPNTNDYLYYLEQIKEHGTGSLRSIYKNSEIAGVHNLLIVIDHIEDIFYITEKLNYVSSTDDDLLFDIVNKTVRFKDVAIYFVLITTTSYLTNLSQYSGLQELISNNQYAIQSLSLAGVNEIIKRGFKDLNTFLNADFIEKIHEELKEDNSLLPNFQCLLHDLFLTTSSTSTDDLNLNHMIGVESFKSLKTYINDRFTNFYDHLNLDQQRELELIFSSFYSPSNFNTKVYATTVGQIKTSAGLSDEEFYNWYSLLQTYFQQLLQIVPSLATQTKTNSDFSKWLSTDLVTLNYLTYFTPHYFNEWMSKESMAHWRFKEYAQFLKAYENGERGLLVSPQLDIALEWLNNDLVNATWASKYSLPFAQVQDFINLSKYEQQQQIKQAELKRSKEAQKERFQKRLYLAFAVVSVFLMLFAAYKWQDADAARESANNEKIVAQQLMKENQIISKLIKIKSKAPFRLLQLEKVGQTKDKKQILNHVNSLLTEELLFDSLNKVYKTSYVTDDWMHELNVTALSLLEGKQGYTETSMLLGALKTYPILDFSIYGDKIAFVGHRNKLSLVYLNNLNRTSTINHGGLFKGAIKRVLFMEENELLLLTDRNELIQLSISTEEAKIIHKASSSEPIKDFIYNRLEQLIVIVKEKQLLFISSNGAQKTVNQLGDHYTATFHDNQLYVATNQGVYLVHDDSSIKKLDLLNDNEPSLNGLTAFHIKGSYLFLGFNNGAVKMYQLDQSKLTLEHVFTLDEHSGRVTSIYYNNLEKLLYTSGTDDRIFRYNLRIEDDEIDEDFSELKGHKSTVWKIDGFINKKGQQILVTADQGGHLLSWYIDDIEMVKDLKSLVDEQSKN